MWLEAMRQVRVERIVGDDVYWLQRWKGKRDKVVVGGLVGGGEEDGRLWLWKQQAITH